MKRYFIVLFMVVAIMTACTKGSDSENSIHNPTETPDINTLPESVTIADNTKLISSEQVKYIESVSTDNSSITFSASTPQDKLPIKGDIILQFTPTEQFPYGFLGRVEDISYQSNGITVTTSDVALDEAFDYFVLEQPLDIADSSRLTWGKDEYGNSYISQNIDGSFQATDNIFINVGGNIMYQSNIVLRVNIDKSKSKNEFEFAVKNRTIASNVGINITGKSGTAPEKCQLKIGNGIPINFSKIGIQLVVQPYLGVELEGEVGLGYNLSFENSSSFAINHTGKWSALSESAEKNQSSETEIDHSGNFTLNGSVTISVIPAMEFRLFGRDNLKIAIEPKANYTLAGDVDIDLGKPDLDGTTLYDTMKDTYLNCGATIGVDAKVDCGFFKNDRLNPTITIPIAEWKLWQQQRYIFPSFENGNIEQNGGTTTTTVELGRDLLFTSEVGIAQYIEDKPTYNNSIKYKNAKDFKEQNPLTADFTTSDNATYYTYTKWGDKVVKCEPIASIVGTWECISEEGLRFDDVINKWYDWIKFSPFSEAEGCSHRWYYTFKYDLTGKLTTYYQGYLYQDNYAESEDYFDYSIKQNTLCKHKRVFIGFWVDEYTTYKIELLTNNELIISEVFDDGGYERYTFIKALTEL